MKEKRIVKIQLSDGTVRDADIEVSSETPWRLVLAGLPLSNQKFGGDDLFQALVALRRELEKIGARLLCAGSRPDVFPSGMSRGMGGGRKAYITRLGAPALRTDLVDILDHAEPENVGTVEQQEEFHERWVKSLRQ